MLNNIIYQGRDGQYFQHGYLKSVFPRQSYFVTSFFTTVMKMQWYRGSKHFRVVFLIFLNYSKTLPVKMMAFWAKETQPKVLPI